MELQYKNEGMPVLSPQDMPTAALQQCWFNQAVADLISLPLTSGQCLAIAKLAAVKLVEAESLEGKKG